MTSPPDRPRLAELLAALSLGTDLGSGFPVEKTLRNTVLALAIAGELDLDERVRSDLYYASLLRFVGCTAFTYEASRMAGDEFAALRAFATADQTEPGEVLHAVFELGRGQSVPRRTRIVTKNLVRGKSFGAFVVRADCEATARFARRFGMGSGVPGILDQSYERWDGKGAPRGARGDEIAPAARVLALAHQAEFFHRAGGHPAAVEMARRRSSGWFDPECVDAFERCAAAVFERIDTRSVWDEALAAEPPPVVSVGPGAVDDLAAGFADFADLKSPYLLGHSSGVARLAGTAARALHLREETVKLVERAALLHDLGRIAIPVAIWDKPRALSASEWEQVRLHAYHGERVLARSATLGPIGALAGLHHERLDGRGYHRGLDASALDVPARILAAADIFQALTEPRPHRKALDPPAAARVLEEEASAGRLDPDAVGAVAAAGGQAVRPLRAWPAGLTDREVDVLRLLARGSSKKEVAKALGIASGTVHTHVVHIYAKVGSSTRAGIALFAMENGLVERGARDTSNGL